MAQEFESPGSEYNQPKQRREADELRAPAPETAEPAGELGIDRKLSAKSAAERKAAQKEKQKKRHKLLKKMVYAAASAVAVVGLSQSVGTQSAAGTYAVYIGTDGVFPYYEHEDGSYGGVTSYLPQTRYYYYTDYEIPEHTETVVDSHEGMDFAYEITFLPMSALEKRDGISFDAETYTLTLEDYTNTILYVTVSETNEEDTLTIRLEGTNELGFLHIAGVEHVIFSGTGSLDVVGIYEHYNVATEAYEEVNRSGDIIVLAEEAGYYPKVFVEDECRLTAGTMIVYSLVTFQDTPVSGNLEWAEMSELMSEEADWYNYAYEYYDIAPLDDDTSSDSSTITANDATTLMDIIGEIFTGQTEGDGETETVGGSGTVSAGTSETGTEAWLTRDQGTVFNNSAIEHEQIVSITFLDSLEGMPSDAWDASNNGNGTIMAWVIAADDNDGTDLETTYDLYIAAEGGVKANPNCCKLFGPYRNLTSVNFNGNFDTSDVTDMSDMFYVCENLTSLDLSSLDTANVTDMSGMFYSCQSLTSLNLSGLNTSSVVDMSGMFRFCENLTYLNLSGMNTSNVTDMSYMFQNSGLISLDLSSFDTSNVTNMEYMFGSCISLTSLDLSSFDTSSVTDMSGMFGSCRGLTSLDVSNFDTSNVTSMSSMFYHCFSLISLDVSSFNTSKVTTMYQMFYGCSMLTELDISNFDMSALEENGAVEMFAGTTLGD